MRKVTMAGTEGETGVCNARLLQVSENNKKHFVENHTSQKTPFWSVLFKLMCNCNENKSIITNIQLIFHNMFVNLTQV